LPRYNHGVVKRAAVFVFVASLFFCRPSHGQESHAPTQTVAGRTMVVLPFENASPTPGLEWLGESFPETLYQQLNSPLLYVASRDERLRSYDRCGIPAGVYASRATLYRIAEEMDVDYAVLGSYSYNGARLSATAQLLDMRAQKLSSPATESAPLAELGSLQSALAWDLLRLIRSDFSQSKDRYIASVGPIRLDALENYIHGVIATKAAEREQHFREATRLNPDYSEAWLELGKTYYAQRAYEQAIAALSQIRQNGQQASVVSSAVSGAVVSGAVVREANFYLGLAAYAHGDLARSESAFEFVAARVPLAEIYNNLGVVAARRGQKNAADDFERAIQDDPSDADYHFNLGVTLASSGDRTGAAREMRATLDRRPNDAEARMLLDSLAPGAGSSTPGDIVPSSATLKIPAERVKRNYEENAFRQMTTQMEGWAEQQFARSDPRAHAHFHIELGKELMAHGFTTEADAEFRHAAAVDPSSTAALTALAEDYEARGDMQAARAEAEAALRIHESADAYLVLVRLDLQENKIGAATQDIERALQLEPSNPAGQELKRALTAKLAEKSQQ
jgi:Tfp pilus assembly protein PilF/TolB-like protein